MKKIIFLFMLIMIFSSINLIEASGVYRGFESEEVKANSEVEITLDISIDTEDSYNITENIPSGWEVIDAAATKPFGFMPFYPGPGLGGHCIPIDPFYLSWLARAAGMPTRFIELAGEINTGMPEYVVRRVIDALNEQGTVLMLPTRPAGSRSARISASEGRASSMCPA